MILSTTKELRLHIPSNAIDEISSLQGILDNSEKDFLRDKLGDATSSGGTDLRERFLVKQNPVRPITAAHAPTASIPPTDASVSEWR